MGLFIICSSLGCFSSAARQNQELLEADLRSQERHILELKAELDRKEGVIHGLDYEVDRLQQSAASGKPPGQPASPGIVKDIALGRLTGGYQQNPRIQFDDALQVILEPRDSDGHAIKAPGSVHIDVFEITVQGLKSPLSSWDITQRELRRLWNEPLIGGPSYRILLAWKAYPTTERLRVVARFTTLDGQLYEAERDITIKLPMGLPRPGLPVGIPGGYSVMTPGKAQPAPLPGKSALPQATARENSAPAIEARGEPVKRQAPEAIPPKLSESPSTAGERSAIPVIPFPPREFPTLPSADAAKPVSPEKSLVPPLPEPPAIPKLEGQAPASLSGQDKLPVPRTAPESSQPLVPGVNEPRSQAQPQGALPLTAPPPAAWRERHQPFIQVQNEEAGIRLARPIPKSQQRD